MNEETTKPSKDKTEINLDSEEIDPNRVLFDNECIVNIPVPEAKVFNNLAEYYSNTFARKKSISSTSTPNIRPQTLKVENISQKNDKVQTQMPIRKKLSDVIQRMNSSHGPLSTLYRSLNHVIKVFIRRRRNAASRKERFSWITGTVIAFDKHLNLSLKDATEEYFHHNLNITIKKHSKHMLIRGDNVVLLSNQV